MTIEKSKSRLIYIDNVSNKGKSIVPCSAQKLTIDRENRHIDYVARQEWGLGKSGLCQTQCVLCVMPINTMCVCHCVSVNWDEGLLYAQPKKSISAGLSNKIWCSCSRAPGFPKKIVKIRKNIHFIDSPIECELFE